MPKWNSEAMLEGNIIAIVKQDRVDKILGDPEPPENYFFNLQLIPAEYLTQL